MSNSLPFSLVQECPMGLKLIKRNIFQDDRGIFSKTYQHNIFETLGIEFDVQESVYSTSEKGVLRGMHFQERPYGQAKLIHVIEGEILDVALSLDPRHKDHPFFSAILSSDNCHSLFIPDSFAHGYLVLSDRAIVSYQSSSIYNPSNEKVISYNSFGFDWPLDELIMSTKDKNGTNYGDLHDK
jgi:dTDP-4-dehydrorhamnose 3,5-epimerase